MSPGTSPLAGRSTHFPSRRTFAVRASLFFSSSISSFALFSCHDLTMTFTSRSALMMTRSSQFFRTAEMTAAASIIHGIGPQK
jgi:hypothetical protein